MKTIIGRAGRALRVLAALALLAPAAAAATPGAYERRTVVHDGLARSLLVREPAGAGNGRAGLVILLHGHGGSAAELVGLDRRATPYRGWERIADRERLLIVAPDGLPGSDGLPGWNDCRADAGTNPATDDAGFLAALIDAAVERGAVDPRRVWVTGTSNGGFMTLRMAVEHPRRLAGAAAIVAAMPADSECAPPSRPLPVLLMNGTADPLVPYRGGNVAGDGDRGTVQSAGDSTALWRGLAGAGGAPLVTRFPNRLRSDRSTAVRELSLAADGRPAAALFRIEGGGHLEPSRVERYDGLVTLLLGAQNGDIEMAERVWEFFAASAR